MVQPCEAVLRKSNITCMKSTKFIELVQKGLWSMPYVLNEAHMVLVFKLVPCCTSIDYYRYHLYHRPQNMKYSNKQRNYHEGCYNLGHILAIN